MPKFVVTAPDGAKYEVNAPEGATEADAIAYIRKQAKPKEPAYDPTEGMSTFEKGAAGAGKAVVDLYRGAKQRLGIGDQDALQAEVDEAKKLDAPLMNTGAGVVGNIAGNVAATAVPMGLAAKGAMAIPAIANLVKAAIAARPIATAAGIGAGTGGVTGALEPTATGESVGKNIAVGAGIGAAGGLIPGALSRVVKPQTGEDALALIEAGVRLPPGRTLGGAAARLEQGAESIPIVGDAIKGSHRTAIEDFNRAAYARALGPIGEKATQNMPVGYKGVEMVENKLSNAYEKVLDKIKIVKFDNQFTDEVGTVISMAASDLDDAAARQLERIVTRHIYDRVTPAGTVSARTMKVIESELGRLSRGFNRSPDFDKQQLSDAVREVQAAVRRATERSAPEFVDELKAVNTGFANFVRVEAAAARQGSKEGIFTPAALRGSARAGAGGPRKGEFAQGKALMQDLADAGESVLGSKVPDSGTPFRLLGSLGLGNLAGLLEPTTLAAGATAMLPYTKLGGRATLAALARRPDSAQTLADVLQYGAPAGGFASGLLAPSLAGPQ